MTPEPDTGKALTLTTEQIASFEAKFSNCRLTGVTQQAASKMSELSTVMPANQWNREYGQPVSVGS